MGLSRKHIVVAIGPDLERIHRGYILSFKTTKYKVVRCANIESFLAYAEQGVDLVVIGADTGIAEATPDALVEALQAIEPPLTAPVLFLRDPKNPSIGVPETRSLTILSRWSEAREALNIKRLTAAEPVKKPKAPEESILEAEAQLEKAQEPTNLIIEPSSDRRRPVEKGSETVKFFGIKTEPKQDRRAPDEGRRRDEEPVEEAASAKSADVGAGASEPVPEQPERETPAEKPAQSPDAPAEPERAEPPELSDVAAAVSDIMGTSDAGQRAVASPLPAELHAKHEAPAPPPAETVETPSEEAMTTMPPEVEAAVRPEASADAPAEVKAAAPLEPVAPARSRPRVNEPSVIVDGPSEELPPGKGPRPAQGAAPRSATKRHTASRRSSVMIWAVLIVVVGVAAAVVVLWMHRTRQGVIVSGPTLGTVELGGGHGRPGEEVAAAVGAPVDAGTGSAAIAEAGLEAGVEPPSMAGDAGDEGDGGVEPDGAALAAVPMPAIEEIVLPMKFVRSSPEPYAVNRRELRELIKRIKADRRVRYEVVGHGAPDENSSFVKRLGLLRAKVARNIICRLGPARSRFRLRSAGADEPLSVEGLTGHDLNNAQRRVVLRVIGE